VSKQKFHSVLRINAVVIFSHAVVLLIVGLATHNLGLMVNKITIAGTSTKIMVLNFPPMSRWLDLLIWPTCTAIFMLLPLAIKHLPSINDRGKESLNENSGTFVVGGTIMALFFLCSGVPIVGAGIALTVGLLFSLLFGICFGAELKDLPFAGLILGLSGGMTPGLVAGLVFGLTFGLASWILVALAFALPCELIGLFFRHRHAIGNFLTAENIRNAKTNTA